jgi:outer membrane protein assembly factor BamE (lipoprotein component of BamABCDE complex)
MHRGIQSAFLASLSFNFLEKRMSRLIALCISACIMMIAGCAAPAQVAPVQNDSGDRISVGTVQREIRVGMSSAEVASVLGSPNIVTTDEQRREVWVYDKVSSEVSYSSRSSYGSLILVGGESSSGAAVRSQRTLTVIIKFDNERKVRDFAYRQSSF